jgi:hypothetical protein
MPEEQDDCYSLIVFILIIEKKVYNYFLSNLLDVYHFNSI